MLSAPGLPSRCVRSLPPGSTAYGGRVTSRLDRFRAICLALPEAEERTTWGHPTFRVRDKIFASCAGDFSTLGFKAHPDELEPLLADDRFERAAYVGRYGWLTMTLADRIDWVEVDELVRSSYLQIAPKKLRALVEDQHVIDPEAAPS